MSGWYVRADDFNSFKKTVNSEIENLSKIVSANVTDDEAEIQRILSVAKDNLNGIESLQGKINEYVNLLSGMSKEAISEKNNFEKVRAELEDSKSVLDEGISKSRVELNELLENSKSIQNSREQVDKDLAGIRKALEESSELPDHVEDITSLLNDAEEKDQQLNDLVSHSMRRKSDIDSMHKEIVGYSIENDEGEVEQIEGLRHELEESYSVLNARSKSIQKEVEDSIANIKSDYSDEITRIENDANKVITSSKNKINSVSDKLTRLLPGAMAEGLSAAYDKKKEEEIESQSKLEVTFRVAIAVLVLISLIPFFVDIYLVAYLKQELISVVKDTPNLLISILPLYFPIFWLAYSTNKKLNLSKRLIEEYTHKSVLGTTFDGLSTQIESLPDDGNMRDELRAKLLFNLLQVSSENPGKLITNYDKSDHPLMEALENSSKLSYSVEALSRLPGFSSIAGKLSEKSEKILESQKKKVEVGIDVQEAFDAPLSEGVNAGQGS